MSGQEPPRVERMRETREGSGIWVIQTHNEKGHVVYDAVDTNRKVDEALTPQEIKALDSQTRREINDAMHELQREERGAGKGEDKSPGLVETPHVRLDPGLPTTVQRGEYHTWRESPEKYKERMEKFGQERKEAKERDQGHERGYER